jgi:hypothetical protein
LRTRSRGGHRCCGDVCAQRDRRRRGAGRGSGRLRGAGRLRGSGRLCGRGCLREAGRCGPGGGGGHLACAGRAGLDDDTASLDAGRCDGTNPLLELGGTLGRAAGPVAQALDLASLGEGQQRQDGDAY